MITGDILYVTRSDAGHWAVAVKEALRQYGAVAFETFSDSQSDTYAVPADVVSLIPNTLDPYLFDLNYLTTNGLNDESMSVIGAFAQYTPGAPLSTLWDNNTVQYSNLGIVNSQALSIPKDKAATFGSYLLSQPPSLPYGVEKIWLDKVATASLDQSVPMIGGDIARNVLGYNGSGINIAILDTGIDKTHPDFFYPNGTSKVIVYADETCKVVPMVNCYHNPYDYFGHGTHVASIAAGTGAASNGRYTGVAPGARLMSVKVLNDQGFGFYSWILYGLLQTVQGFFNSTRPDVISMSLGGLPSDGSDPLSQLINLVVTTYNIPIAIAAGNDGCNFCVSSPAAADSAIAVAATTKTASNGSISIASFSSRGPRQDTYSIKPDISAPGVGVVAACSSTATVIACPTGSRYVRLSGTSMATPHVSGSIALLLQQAKQQGTTLTPSEIKDMLQSSSNVLVPSLPSQPDIDIYQQGAGLVRIDKALTANVTFDPAEISFGLVPVDTASLQATFNVTNHGPTTVNLNLSWDMRDVRTIQSPISANSSYANLVSLDQTRLTIPAGAAMTVTFTINAPDAPTRKLWSVFSGRIFASIGNRVAAHAIFGFTKEGPRQTAQVTGINHDGTRGTGMVSYYDALDPLGLVSFLMPFDSTGHLSLRLPLGTYNFIMDLVLNPFPSFPSGYLSFYRIVSLEVPVTDSPASVTLDASKAGPVTLNLQADPSATLGLQQDDWLVYNRPDGTDIQFGFTSLGATWYVYAVNTVTAKIGTLIIYDRWLVSRSPEATSPVVYDLTMTSYIQQPTTHTISDLSTLARTFASFHADVPRAKGVGRWAFSTAFNQFVSFGGVGPVVAPFQRIEYQTPNEAIFNEFFVPDEGPSLLVLQSGFKTPYFGDFNYGRVYSPGETFYEDFAAQPVHPKLTLAVRQGNTLTLGGFEISDPFGHVGLFVNYRALRFTIRVYVNGVLNATGTQLWLSPISVTLPSTPATVEVQMTLQPDLSWSRLATSVTSYFVFKTRSNLQGPISIPTYNYNVSGLNISNIVPVKGSQTNLLIDVSTLAPTGAIINPANTTAQISIDDGADWINASLVKLGSRGMTVSADIPTIGPGPFLVSLRIDVIARPDIVYSQTIIRAVQIAH